jgi:hypothetical protein
MGMSWRDYSETVQEREALGMNQESRRGHGYVKLV